MKRFLLLSLALALMLTFSSCAHLSRDELNAFLLSDGKSIRDSLSVFPSCVMSYTTVMYSHSAEEYVTFRVTTVLDRESDIRCSEILLDGSSYMSCFIKGDSVYFDTILGKTQKIRASIDSIADFSHLTDVEARISSALLPLTLDAKKLSSLKARLYCERLDGGDTEYRFSLGKEYFTYAYENTSGVFERVADGAQLGSIKVEKYEICYVTDGNGELTGVTDINKFKLKKDGTTLDYEAGVSIRKYEGKLDFDENEYSDSSSGEYINNYKDGTSICR